MPLSLHIPLSLWNFLFRCYSACLAGILGILSWLRSQMTALSPLPDSRLIMPDQAGIGFR